LGIKENGPICDFKKVDRKCGTKYSWAKKYTQNILEAKLYDPTSTPVPPESLSPHKFTRPLCW
jgi:hypothetical protein